MDNKIKINKFLKRHRLKPYQLAQLAGVSFPIVYRYLSGERDIMCTTWDKIDQAMRNYK